MSSLSVEEDQQWVPTHVQVTVLRGRGLRGKGKHGTSDVYTIIQLGKEKYSTCVLEKTTEPEWKEECTFELQPGVLESGTGSNELVLTVMHRALIGLDVFLGQALIMLDNVYHEGRCVKNEWYRLNSKTGKKEKERGEVQVNVQFTRNNLTASMYDLVMKDKGASTFVKLKERIKGKKRPSDEDSSSAVLPGGYGSLCRMRQRLPSDGGGEEDYEDDEGGEVRRSKMRTFFLRGKLRKSSDTRSSTSLGSESSESSSRGGSLSPTAGISVVVSDLSNSPSNSSNLTADNSPEHTANTSSSSLKCEFGDEAGEITIAVPQRTVCVNGSHAYSVQPPDPGSGKPQNSLGLGLLQKTLPLSMSLQNLSPRASTDIRTGPVGDGRRWSFDKPGEEEKAAIAAALEQSGPMRGDEEEEHAGQDVPPESATSTAESETQGKKQRRNLFSHGRSEPAGKGQSQGKDESQRAVAATQEKQRGWFGSKDSNAKPSLVVSPTLDPSTHPHQPVLLPSQHPMGPPVDPTSPVSPLHHTNPFCHSQSTTPPLSPRNPFFSVLQHNPFYEDMLTAQPLKLTLPSLPCLSSSRPPIAHLFPHASNPNLTPTHDNPTTECSSSTRKEVQERPLPPTPTEGETALSKRSSNPFTSHRELELDSEWDESFEAFAAGRLQPPEEAATVCKTQQNIHPLVLCYSKGTGQPEIDADQNTNVKDVPHQQTCTEFGIKVNKATGQVTNTYQFDAFAQFLETIPENTSFESDNIASDTPTNSQKLSACAKTNQANSTNNTDMDQVHGHISSVKPNSSSPDHGSSGLGSSTEEDLLSCLSSYSDKFSASSSEEAEQSSILNFEKSSELAVVKQPSDSEDNITDRSNGLSLVDLDQDTVLQHRDGDVNINNDEGSLSSALTHQHLVITAGETLESEFSDPKPNPNVCLQSEDEDGKKVGEWNRSLEGFIKGSKDLSVSVSNTTHVTTATSSDGELCSINPSFHITTSSPETRWCSSDLPIVSLGGQNASAPSPIPFGPFGDFLNTNHIAISPSQSFDETLLHTQMSNQNTSSFLQSLYVTVDSQAYQSCESYLSPKFTEDSEPNETLHSQNTSLCGDLTEIKSKADISLGKELGKSSNEEMNQTDQLEEFFCRANTPTLEPSFMRGNGFEVLHDELSPQSTTLHRSRSEGTLTPAFDELLLPSFGSDPGAIGEEFPSSQPGPDITFLTSFAPSLTPDSSSSPVALCSLPAFADSTAKSPTSMAGGAVQKSMPPETQQQQEEQEQAADLQKSPHPVKPLTTDVLAEEKRTESRSVLATGLEKLKSTINPGRSSQLSEQDMDKKKSGTEGAGSYYHLNHSELVALLVQREAELERQREEFEQQKRLLAKREVELRKLKPQVQDLEDYIDTLLVRIMEQKPTLLQVRSSKLK